ncbi:hypothetical protein IG631_05496 [Alternaria alternata]|nr:hypothetical protein IG631_05496 [Alternaria alternata]
MTHKENPPCSNAKARETLPPGLWTRCGRRAALTLMSMDAEMILACKTGVVPARELLFPLCSHYPRLLEKHPSDAWIAGAWAVSRRRRAHVKGPLRNGELRRGSGWAKTGRVRAADEKQ